MLQVSESHDFDRDADRVLALFTGRDYFLRKYERLGATEIELLRCEDDGERFMIDVRRRVAQKTPFPDFVEKLIGERVTLQQSDTWWRSRRTGAIEINVVGAPVSIAIDMRLQDIDTGSRLHLDFAINARVPVVGSRIERFLAEDVVQRMRDDMAMSQQLLAESST